MRDLRALVRPASFRGIPFTPTSADTEGLARRIDTHEFPFRDEPFSEDLGRQTPNYTFDCFVTWQDRNRFVAALGIAGPGVLVHPFYGERLVVCSAASSRESTSHAGLTFFALTFVEAGQNRFPDASADTERAVELAADGARPVLCASLEERFSSQVPQWVIDSSVVRVGLLQTALENARAAIPSSVAAEGAEGLAAFNLLLEAFDDAATLVADPAVLASTISDTVRALAGLSTDPLATVRMLERFIEEFGENWPSFEEQSAVGSRYQEGVRQDAMLQLVAGSALVEASVAATQIDLDSYNAAARLRERMVELFDPQLDSAGDIGDDAALRALLDVRRQILEDLRERGAALATVRSLTLSAVTPAIVLGYRLYADADRGDEIAARNRIRHPTFLPAGRPLEVLSA